MSTSPIRNDEWLIEAIHRPELNLEEADGDDNLMTPLKSQR